MRHRARGRQDDGGARLTRRGAERDTFPEHLPRERVVIDPPTPARAAGATAPAQARRGRDADAGDDAPALEGDRDGPVEPCYLCGLPVMRWFHRWSGVST